MAIKHIRRRSDYSAAATIASSKMLSRTNGRHQAHATSPAGIHCGAPPSSGSAVPTFPSLAFSSPVLRLLRCTHDRIHRRRVSRHFVRRGQA